MSAIDIGGERFGRLVVVERAGSKSGQAVWRCRCDCGESVVVAGGSLRRGATRSCGCLQREARSRRRGQRLVERPSYLGAHYRVHSARGKASGYECGCGAPAEQWAYDHTDPDELTTLWVDQKGKERVVAYSAEPEHYLPMCRPCHVRMDQAVAA